MIPVLKYGKNQGVLVLHTFNHLRMLLIVYLEKIKNVWFSSADESAAREYIIYCDNFTRALNVIFGTTGQMIIDSAGDTKIFFYKLFKRCKD